MKLDQFLKYQGFVSTGGEAKQLIQSGLVFVNNSVELRRGRKLIVGDLVVSGLNRAIVKETGGAKGS
ncbi:RNA-binding S4 domain-containing protein [Prochlorococcus sp. MIT 1300]|uniref:RNA-binding S4 domain-containing protein n=1 Tax=Prochlorococcus sp. MIT 1300 TaxID=3096218 RepID=UPI002A759100|nr:RNA-binding S4 domain-containing protein [Prochlorococcus sp. MIT 1300]